MAEVQPLSTENTPGLVPTSQPGTAAPAPAHPAPSPAPAPAPAGHTHSPGKKGSSLLYDESHPV